MVMDENGRNGRKWHLAQQITELVIKPHIMQLSSTTTITTCNHTDSNKSHNRMHNNNYHTDMSWGDFYFSYKYPVSNYNNLQFVNK